MKAVTLFLISACAAISLYAQADLFNQAPPDVDQALRARVNKFYQAHVDGKPRTAMPIVAEDTQDLWFDTDKPQVVHLHDDGSLTITLTKAETYAGIKPPKMLRVIVRNDGGWLKDGELRCPQITPKIQREN